METNMDQELTDKFLHYEELKIQEKELKAEIDALKAELVEHVPEGEKINCATGVVKLKKRDNWTYIPATVQLADDLKARQKEEVAKGDATNNPTYYIEYKHKK